MKKFISSLLALVLILGMVPFQALAAEPASGSEQMVHINPLYADQICEEELWMDGPAPRGSEKSIVYHTSLEDAAAELSQAMADRQETIQIGYQTTGSTYDAWYDVLYAAFEHTGVPTQGDYLYWTYMGAGGSYYGSKKVVLIYTPKFRTTAEQEWEMDGAVEDLLAELNPTGTDYEKLSVVYNWMCDNIYYDYDHYYNDPNYPLQYTAYAALLHRTSVCQGYAVLLYRLALEMGIDCRIIVGLGGGGGHAWNIVRMGEKYYNVDATWDASYAQAGYWYLPYFLTCEETFGWDHFRDEAYDTPEFHEAYPMAETDYDSQAHHYVCTVIEPTCTSQGYSEYYCDHCGQYYYTDYVDALGHAPVTDPAVEPTCTDTGLTKGSHCQTCGKVLVAQTTVPAKGHSYKSVVTKPTCTKEGYTTFTCACGHSYKGDTVKATGHTYKTETQDATCTEAGSITYTCACGYSYTDTIPTQGHQYTSKVTAPTCTEDGYTTHTCACGHSYKDSTVPAKGHSYQSKTYAATCTENGRKVYTCGCGASYTVTIPAKGHSYKAVVTKPTCTEDGYTTYTCTCGHSYKSDTVKAKGHSYKSVVTKPTCTEDGYTTHTCACGHSYKSDTVKAKGHSYKSVVTKPTCTEDGYTTYTCACGYSYKSNIVKATGHTYKTKTTEATCTENGKKVYTCACGYSYTVTIPAKGHSYKSVVTKPTCTKDGYTTYTCACGHSYRGDTVKAKGHSYESVVTDATCTQGGYTTHTCALCGDSYVDGHTNALEHLFVSLQTKEPGCTEAGIMQYICIRCWDEGVSYQETIPAIGHEYEDDVCIRCGKDSGVVDVPVLTVSNVASTGKIRLTWNKVEDAVKYEVYRATSANGTFKYLASTKKTTATNSSGLTLGKTYYYQVVAVAADGTRSEPSAAQSGTCLLPCPEVTLSNIASSGKIKISWKKVSGAVKYEVYRATSEEGPFERITTTKNTSVNNTKITAGTAYYYKVKAIASNSAANSADSEVKARTCDLAQPRVTLSNDPSTGKIVISWESVEGATKYQVYRATSKNGTYSRIITTSSTSITNKKTEAGKTYYYKVRALCDVGAAMGAFSEVKSQVCDLAQPTVSVSLSSRKPRVSWGKVDGAVSYKVYRATSPNGTYSLVKTTSGSYYKDTKAKSGKTYYYKVVAVCSKTAGNSAASGVVSIKSK